MSKIIFSHLLLSVVVFLQTGLVQAQEEPQPHKIAVFAPLYLDSAFDSNDNYRYSKYTLPKFINPGLEFYEGVQMALDSLNKENAKLEVFIYDTKSRTETLQEQLANPDMNGMDLIIVHGSNAEMKVLAEAGLRKNIPVINANLPNEGGTNGNPFFVILNPTLRTQCEGIYKYVQKYYSLEPVVVFRKKGQLEDRIKTYFEEYTKNTVSVPLNIKYVTLSDSFTTSQLRQHLDTTTLTLCIAGSLDETFGKRLVQQLAALNKQNYPSTVVGMPTWDGISFNRSEYKGIDIIFSTPFYNAKVDKVSQSINSKFNKVMYARPSDMVFRGYEVMFRFARMLMQYKIDFPSNLSNKYNKVFTDFDIQPVLNNQTFTLDYFENKKLYFLKWQDGMLKGVF